MRGGMDIAFFETSRVIYSWDANIFRHVFSFLPVRHPLEEKDLYKPARRAQSPTLALDGTNGPFVEVRSLVFGDQLAGWCSFQNSIHPSSHHAHGAAVINDDATPVLKFVSRVLAIIRISTKYAVGRQTRVEIRISSMIIGRNNNPFCQSHTRNNNAYYGGDTAYNNILFNARLLRSDMMKNIQPQE